MPRLRQGVPQTRDDQPARDPAFAEPDFGLRGVDVHIHALGIAGQKQHGGGVTIPREEIHIGRAQGPDQQLVAHGAAIHEEELLHRSATRIGWQGGKPRQANPLALGIDRDRVIGKLAAKDPAETARKRAKQLALFRISAKDLARLIAGKIPQREADIGLRHREALDHIGDGRRLSAIRAQEFQPRWRGVKQIAQLDHGAAIEGGGADGRDIAARNEDLMRLFALHP